MILTRFGIGIKDSNWIIYRTKLLETMAMSSILNQTCQHYEWLIFIDHELEDKYLQKLKDLTSPYPNIHLVPTEPTLTGEKVIQAVDNLKLAHQKEFLVTLRIDDDDALEQTVLENIYQTIYRKRNTKQLKKGLLLSIPCGYYYDIRKSAVTKSKYGFIKKIKHPSIAIGLTLVSQRKDKITCMSFNHTKITTQVVERHGYETDTIMGSKPGWLYVRHEQSESCFYLRPGQHIKLATLNKINHFNVSKTGMDIYLANLKRVKSVTSEGKNFMNQHIQMKRKVIKLKEEYKQANSQERKTILEQIDTLESTIKERAYNITG